MQVTNLALCQTRFRLSISCRKKTAGGVFSRFSSLPAVLKKTMSVSTIDRNRSFQIDDDPELEYWNRVKLHAEKVRRVIEAADETTDPDYKGVTLGYINRELEADPVLTLQALHILEGIQTRELIPERYSFRPRPVRQVPPSEWPDKPIFGRKSYEPRTKPLRDFGSFVI